MIIKSMLMSMILLSAISEASEVKQPDVPILVQEQGFANNYNLSKTMICRDIQWNVQASFDGSRNEPMKGVITVKVGDSGRELDELDQLIFNRISYLDSVSASCNQYQGHRHPTSKLLLRATEKESGAQLLIQVYVERDLEIDVSMSTIS